MVLQLDLGQVVHVKESRNKERRKHQFAKKISKKYKNLFFKEIKRWRRHEGSEYGDKKYSVSISLHFSLWANMSYLHVNSAVGLGTNLGQTSGTSVDSWPPLDTGITSTDLMMKTDTQWPSLFTFHFGTMGPTCT